MAEFKFSGSQPRVYNDHREAEHLIKKHEFIFNPENHVLSKLKSQLEEIVKQPNGMFSKVDLFEDHGTFGQGKYPKR